ncbi:MAG: DUF3291 domain-containing protein [Sphingomicrobium sp.]
MSSAWHLAQINIGKMLGLRGDPVVEGFYEELDRVNALADSSPGFVWRLVGEAGQNATDIQPTADPLLLMNMSVWEDAESLFEFVYRSSHTPVMAQRRNWFESFDGAHMALWWIPAGTIPTVNDGLSRLWHLDRFGPTPHAFTFKLRFPPPDRAEPPVDMQPDPWCVGNA